MHSLCEGVGEMGIVAPTPVQALAIPELLAGTSAIVTAKTGTGKTLAYLLPLLHRLKAHEAKFGRVAAATKRGPIIVVALPTRELVLQTTAVVRKLSFTSKFTTEAMVGSTYRPPRRSLDVLVGALPAIVAGLKDGRIRLDDCSALVMDEADVLLSPEQGFAHDAATMLGAVPASAQIVLVGATAAHRTAPFVRDALAKVRSKKAGGGVAKPNFVEIAAEDVGFVPSSVAFGLRRTFHYDKLPTLMTEVRRCIGGKRRRVLVFCNTTQGVNAVARHLEEVLDPAEAAVLALSSDMRPDDRLQTYKYLLNVQMTPELRRKADEDLNGRTLFIICTDLASRGLNFQFLDEVIMFDPPPSEIDFLHRSGRVGRMETPGRVSIIAARGEWGFARTATKALNASRVTNTPIRFEYPTPREQERLERASASSSSASSSSASSPPSRAAVEERSRRRL